MNGTPERDNDRRERFGFGAKRLAHERARERDLRDNFEKNEQIDVFVEKSPVQNGGEEAVGKVYSNGVNDAVVFITPLSCTLEPSDRVQCRIIHVGSNMIKAHAIARLN